MEREIYSSIGVIRLIEMLKWSRTREEIKHFQLHDLRGVKLPLEGMVDV